jgi:hypothetical protein
MRGERAIFLPLICSQRPAGFHAPAREPEDSGSASHKGLDRAVSQQHAQASGMRASTALLLAATMLDNTMGCMGFIKLLQHVR